MGTPGTAVPWQGRTRVRVVGVPHPARVDDTTCTLLPRIAEAIDPTATIALPTEVFTDIPEGELRTGDILVQVAPRDGQPELVLIHTEVQGKEGPAFVYRMWEYHALYTLR